MEDNKNSSQGHTFYRISKTIQVKDKPQHQATYWGRTIASKSCQVTVPRPYYTRTKRRELLKTYKVHEDDLSKKSLEYARLPSPKQNYAVKKKQTPNPLKKRNLAQEFRKLLKKKVDTDREYLLDSIIIGYMYQERKKQDEAQHQKEINTEKRSGSRNHYFPPLDKGQSLHQSTQISKGMLTYQHAL